MKIYAYFTKTAPRSWIAHALVTIALAAAAAAAATLLKATNPTQHFTATALAVAILYSVKEYRDWRKYQRIKGWKKPRWNRISPAQDIFGDLLGPYTVAATATILQIIGNM